MSGVQLEGAAPPEPTLTADAAIVAGLLVRDPAAVADLYDRYADRLLGFSHGMLRDSHEAADALHDTILVAVERIGQLRDPERLRPWLYAIARTQCLARLRRRERTALSEDPTEIAGGRTMGAEPPADDTARSAEGGEAAELVWAAAEGLDESDRVLLELHLRQGLQGAELAAAAGVKSGQISMVTGRMRERLERALGALLVARHGRRDCDELDGLLRDWDGRLTVLMRKRVARHVERCEVCAERRTGLVAPLGSLAVGLPVIAATTDLRAAVLAGADRIWGGEPAPDVTGQATWGGDGFPPDPPAVASAVATEPGSAARRRGMALAAAAVLVLLGGLFAWQAAADRGDDEVRADAAAFAPGAPEGASGTDEDDAAALAADDGGDDGGDDGEEVVPVSTTTPTTTTPVAPGTTPVAPGATTTTTALPLADPPDPAPGATQPAPGPGVGSGSATTPAPPSTTSPPPPPNRAPSITQVTVPSDLRTACGSPSTGVVDVRAADPDGLAGLTATIRVQGPDGTSDPVVNGLGGGRFQATIGPFSSLGPVTVTVTVRDAAGATASTSRNVPLEIAPC